MSAVEKTRSVVKNASSHARQKLTINGRDKANSQRPTRVTIAIIKMPLTPNFFYSHQKIYLFPISLVKKLQLYVFSSIFCEFLKF